MANATHPGTIYIPGSDLPLAHATVRAVPQVAGKWISNVGSVNYIGDVVAQTGTDGVIQGGGIRVPIKTDVLWELRIEPKQRDIAPFTLGIFNLNTSGVDLKDLVGTVPLMVEASTFADFAAVLALGTTDDSIIAAKIADTTPSATRTALTAEFAMVRENMLFASREGVLQNNTDPSGTNHTAFATAVATAANFNRVLYLDGPEPPTSTPATIRVSSPVALTTSVRIKGTPGARIVIANSGAGISIAPTPAPIRTGTPAAGNPMYPDFTAGATTVTFTGQSWTTNQHAGKWLEIIDPSTYGVNGLTETAHRVRILSNTATVLTLQFPLGRDSGTGAGTHVAGDFSASPVSLASSASIVTPIPQVWLEDVTIDRSVTGNTNLTISYVDEVYEKNLSSLNSGNYATATGNAINHYQCSKIRSYNLNVKQAGNFGVFCYNSDNVRFYSPTTTNFAGQFGLQLKDCRDAKVYGGHVTGDGTSGTTGYNVKCSGLNATYTQHLIECYAESTAAGFEFSTIQNEGTYYTGSDFKTSKSTARNVLTAGFSTIIDAMTVDVDKDWTWEGCEVDTAGQVGYAPTTGTRMYNCSARRTAFEAVSVGGFTVKSGTNETAYYPVRDIRIFGMVIEDCCTAHSAGSAARSAPVLVGNGVLRFRMKSTTSVRNRAGDNIMRLVREPAAVAASGSMGTNDNVLAKAAADYTEVEDWSHVDTSVISTALVQDFLFVGTNSRARGSSRGDSYFGSPTINKIDYSTGGAGSGLTAANNLSDLVSTSTARTNLGLGTAAVLNVGVASGVAGLGTGGKVPLSQLGSGVAEGNVLKIVGGNSAWTAPTSGSTVDVVVDYGADPTGATDCAAIFDAALAASREVHVPAGSFRFDRPLAVRVPGAAGMSITGAGKTMTEFLVSSTFHANYPGQYLMTIAGTGSPIGQTNYALTTTPFTAAGSTTYTPGASGWTTQLGVTGAAGSNIKVTAGSLTGTATLTINVDQTNDVTFATGVTTQSFTMDTSESAVTKRFLSNGGSWTARYFRVRAVMTGTPTSWPVDIIFENTYTPAQGVNLSGFRINATGSGAGQDADGRWDSKGILLDRVKWLSMRDVHLNKCRGQALRCMEVWDSYIADVKVLKSADATALLPAVAFEPFDEFSSVSNCNNSTIVQLHCEDNKYTQVYLGRRTRRLRFFGLKCHGDLASNSVMTLAPHVRLESAFTNQFVAYSMNRAGQHHFELGEHPLEVTYGASQSGGRTRSDRNAFIGGFQDSARTNPTSVAGAASTRIIAGNHNRWLGTSFSNNPKAAQIDSGNVGNLWAKDCEFHDILNTTGTLTGTIADEIIGPCFADWVNPSTNVPYRWDGTTLSQQGNPSWVATFSAAKGNVAVQTGTYRYYVNEACTVIATRSAVGTAPSGSTLIVDVKKNGTSIFATTTTNRPTITAGAFTALGGTPDTTALAAGDYLTVDVLQVGSGTPGADLTVTVQLQRV